MAPSTAGLGRGERVPEEEASGGEQEIVGVGKGRRGKGSRW